MSSGKHEKCVNKTYSIDSCRYRQTAELNSYFQNQTRRKMNSRKYRKCVNKTYSHKDTNNVLSRVGIDFNDIPLKRDLQIVIMGDSLGAPLSKQEMLEIQQLLIYEINKISYQYHAPELKFHSSTLLKSGWILLNCYDVSTFHWVFDWSAKVNTVISKTFTLVKASEAPWKPARISLTISEASIDVNGVIKLLISQNSNLQLDTWKHIETQKINGCWCLHFLVPGDGIRRLEGSFWKVHFILEMLSVSTVEDQCSDINEK